LIPDKVARTPDMNITAIKNALETNCCTIEIERLNRCRSQEERYRTLLGIRYMLEARIEECENQGQMTRALDLGRIAAQITTTVNGRNG